MPSLADFLQHFSQTLEAEAIEWCIARGDECLPHALKGGDLDLIVRKEDIGRIIRLFDSMPDIVITGYTRRSWVVNLFLDGIRDGSRTGVQIDLIHAPGWRGVEYLSAAQMLARRQRHEAGYVADEAHRGILSALPHLLETGCLKPSAQTRIQTLMASESARGLFQAITGQAWNGATHYPRRHLRGQFIKTAWRSERWKMLPGLWRYVWREWRLRMGQDHVDRIVLLGPDGSGKSSVMEALAGAADGWRKQTRCYHVKPGFLLRRREMRRGVVTSPHLQPPRPMWQGWLKMTMYLVEYWGNRLVRPLRVPGVLLYDRYMHDMALDPLRYRLPEHAAPMARRMAALAPVPHLFLCLSAAPETIQSRKSEVPVATTRQQCAAYEAFARQHQNAALIDADMPLSQVIEQAQAHVRQHLVARTRRRLQREKWS